MQFRRSLRAPAAVDTSTLLSKPTGVAALTTSTGGPMVDGSGGGGGGDDTQLADGGDDLRVGMAD